MRRLLRYLRGLRMGYTWTDSNAPVRDKCSGCPVCKPARSHTGFTSLPGEPEIGSKEWWDKANKYYENWPEDGGW